MDSRQLTRARAPHAGPRLLASMVGATFLALAAARLVLHVPKPMLAVAGGLFLLCCAIFHLYHRFWVGSLRWKVAGLIVAWVGLSAALFLAGFHVDRSGWIYYRLTGYDVTRSEEKSHLADVPVRAFLAYNRNFAADPRSPGHIVLPRGEHVIDHTVVVPRGTLVGIEAGTVLRFEHGSSLVSYSPIIARGTESDPIVFTSRDRWRKWGAVGIVGQGLSVFEHALFENGRHGRVNGMDFFGTLSLLGADVDIRRSRFVHLRGKDAVYVRGGRVTIQDNLFEDVRKDGLDMDGGSGVVSRNRFVDCRDEGIDLDQAWDVQIVDNVILDARGGRIGSDGDLEALRARNTLGTTRDR